jgi:hypothetical protein
MLCAVGRAHQLEHAGYSRPEELSPRLSRYLLIK